jgi:L-rhamnose isomerase
MGRSVNYLTGATKIAYFDVSDFDEQFGWDLFEDDIKTQLKEKFKSLYEPLCRTWDSNEVKIILENKLVEIGISEYMGLASVSVRISPETSYTGQRGFAKRFIGAVERKLEEMSEFTKVGTFSSGEAVYEQSHS